MGGIPAFDSRGGGIMRVDVGRGVIPEFESRGGGMIDGGPFG